MCPYCGYIGDDPRMPIGAQTVYDPAPQLQFEIERWDSHRKKMDPERVIPEDNMKIWDTLRNWKHVQAMLPALAMIMSQLENMQEQIAQIRGELQQYRIAKADTAWDQLHQALKITDRRRCEQSIMIAIGKRK